MKGKMAFEVRVYTSGDVALSTYVTTERVEGDGVFGPYTVEFDMPPEVMAEVKRRKEEARQKTLEGRVAEAKPLPGPEVIPGGESEGRHYKAGVAE